MTAGRPDRALHRWAASGAMSLTGRADGPPVAVAGDPVGQVQADLHLFAELMSPHSRPSPRLPDARLLSERAPLAGFRRNGPRSCGGAFRFLATEDGFLGLSLARPVDVDMVPALISSSLLAQRLATAHDIDREALAWAAAGEWAKSARTAEAVDRARLLGLACAGVGAGARTDRTDDRPGRADAIGPPERSSVTRNVPRTPLVVDLTSLWAGPLCAHLLGLSGATVIKVESPHRPDGARRGSPEFFDLLHAGHHMVSLDLRSQRDVAQLRRLFERADLVLEGSRARGLRQLGIVAEEIVATGTAWLSITAHGRASDTVGFGDDVAADGGLLAWEDGVPMPAGDALADPLTGVAAAVAAAELLGSHTPRLHEVVMLDVVRRAASAGGPAAHTVHRVGDTWWVETASGRSRVAGPHVRAATGTAAALGSANGTVIR